MISKEDFIRIFKLGYECRLKENDYDPMAYYEEEPNNKSCEKCTNFSLETQIMGICSHFTCPKVDYYIDKDFYCSRFEAKGE